MTTKEIENITFEILKKQPKHYPGRTRSEAISFFNAELGLDWIGGI